MKVIIACLNSKYIHASLSPWCLKAGITAFCRGNIEAKVSEATINSDLEKYLSEIEKENPEIVCFSSYIWNIEKTLFLAKRLKEKLNCKIILGGPEVSFRSENILENFLFVDFVLSGEGEESLPKLLDILYFKGDLNTAENLTFRKNGQIVKLAEKEYKGTPISPYTKEFFENLKGRISYIETSRGCPFRCAFCLSGRGSPLRFFDIDIVKENIIKLANSGTKTVKFVDRTFNANSKRANEILSFIIENYNKEIPKGVCFHFEIAGDILTEETFNILKTAPVGLIQLEIGMQTFNEETLKTINRKTDTKKLKENIKRLVSLENMHIHIDLIAGLTGEDIKSFEESFNIGYSLKPNMLQLGFLKLLYGANMRENPEKYPCEFSETPPYEITKTPWLSQEEIKKIKKTEDALERMYNSGRFLFTLEYLLSKCGFTPFKLFMDFGNQYDGNHTTLAEYAQNIFDYFKAFSKEDVLKEKIVCDMLCCDSSSQIPKEFMEYSPFHKRVKEYFKNTGKKTFKIAIFKERGQVFFVDYSLSKNLFGRREGKYYPLEMFLEEKE